MTNFAAMTPGMAGCCRYGRDNRPAATIRCNTVSHFKVLIYKTSSMPSEPPSEGRRGAVHELYLVKSLVHGSEVLWAFQQPGETLRLRDVMDRTGFPKGMCFRLLYTLRHCGFIEKVDRKSTRLNSSHLVISYAVFCLKKKKQRRSEYEELADL